VRSVSSVNMSSSVSVWVRIPATRGVRVLRHLGPSRNKEGAGKAGRRSHPRVPCNKKHGGRTTGSTGNTPAFPARWFTACFELSPVTGSFATVAPGKLASQELGASIGAPGPHDFAVRLARARRSRAGASTASHRNVRDDREPPLIRVRRAD
jgi:hypothetical protein